METLADLNAKLEEVERKLSACEQFFRPLIGKPLSVHDLEVYSSIFSVIEDKGRLWRERCEILAHMKELGEKQ